MFLQRRLPRIPPLSRRCLPTTPTRSLVYVRFGGQRGPQHNQFPQFKGDVRDPRTWDPRLKGLAIAGGIAGVYYVAHLEQVPETGRWRFMNTSPEAEAKIGEAIRQETRRELQSAILPAHHPMTIHVRRVVSRILDANHLGSLRDAAAPTRRPLSVFGALMGSTTPGDSEEDWNPDARFESGGGGAGAAPTPGMAPVYGPQKVWDVIVVDDRKMINAMATPGLIVVFTGILPVCQDEEGLAAVLSHEIGHVVARHTAERMSSQTLTWLVLIALTATTGIDLGLTNFLQKFIFELPNSRKQETEADVIGLRLMSKACYDPAASPRMFERLASVEKKLAAGVNLDFFQTHPSSEKRVKFLEERLHEGYELMAQNPECDRIRQQLEAFRATARPMGFDEHNHFVLR